MTTNHQYLRLKKLTGRDIIRIAARHNLREIQVEIGADSHIDASRVHLNRIMAGAATAAQVAAEAAHLLRDRGVRKLRKDAVQAVEIVASVPDSATVDHGTFFADALEWVRKTFGAPILSAVVHLDEAAPHCHILVLPLIDGRMVGSDLVGGRARLCALQTDFFEQVAHAHGMVRPKPRRHMSSALRKKAASLTLGAIQANPDLLFTGEVERALLVLIKSDPEPLLAALNLSTPLSKPAKSFVEIMIKPCNPEKPIGFNETPIGFSRRPTRDRTLSCVGFDPPAVPPPGANNGSDTFTRCSNNVPAEYWDSVHGEFRPPSKTSRPSVRDDAARELRRGLARLKPSRASGE